MEAGPDRVLLLGLMGAGKTTVGVALAARLGWPWLDNDALVAAATGASKETLLERDGLAGLRVAETAALRLALTRPGPLVAGVAAGVVLAAANVELLRRASLVVWLRARHDTLVARLDAERQDRPLLEGDTAAAVERLAAQREPRFAEVAGLVVDVDDRSAAEIVEQLAGEVSARVTESVTGC